MDVIFVEEHDPHVNPLGVKGVGEIAMVGVAPAITNAIFHATGRNPRPPGHDRILALRKSRHEMKVILFGATGMVGQGVLRECLAAHEWNRSW